MQILSITEVTRKKKKIILEDDTSFVLYNNEVRQFHLKEGEELGQELYEKIIRDILTKRGISRALHLLLVQMRTRKELEDRLRRDGYPQYVIEEACDYAEHFHYIDDEEYARSYLAGKCGIKSRRILARELIERGVEESVAEEVLSERSDEEELSLCFACVRKKLGDIHKVDEAEYRRAWSYLARRGYSAAQIGKALRPYTEDSNEND